MLSEKEKPLCSRQRFIVIFCFQNADSIYSFYKAMVRLRKEHRVISEGKIEFLYPDNTDLLAYRRYGSADKEELLVLCNLTEQEIHAELPDA